MNISKYLILYPGPRHYQPRMKLVSKLKNLPADSVAIKLNIDVPNSIFKKPELRADIKIHEQDISKTVQVIDNIKQELKKSLGIEMSINIIKAE